MSDLSVDYLRTVLDYEPSTGHFRWRVRTNGNVRVGMIAGNSTGGGRRYPQVRVGGRLYLAHRLAWLYVTGEWPSNQIDHINGDCFDNRITNLRLASPSQNSANRRARFGMKGSSRIASGKWQARINIKGQLHYLGLFSTPEEANAAYRAKATELFGEYARW